MLCTLYERTGMLLHVSFQESKFQHLQIQPNESEVSKISLLAMCLIEIEYYKYSHQKHNHVN